MGRWLTVSVGLIFFAALLVGGPPAASKGAYSPDFNTLTVDNDFSASGGGSPTGKTTEVWTRK
jgi:hypothetical protein